MNNAGYIVGEGVIDHGGPHCELLFRLLARDLQNPWSTWMQVFTNNVIALQVSYQNMFIIFYHIIIK